MACIRHSCGPTLNRSGQRRKGKGGGVRISTFMFRYVLFTNGVLRRNCRKPFGKTSRRSPATPFTRRSNFHDPFPPFFLWLSWQLKIPKPYSEQTAQEDYDEGESKFRP